MDKYLSIITNFGCHGRCPYCIVRENGIKVPRTTIDSLDKLPEAIAHVRANIVSVSGGGDPLHEYGLKNYNTEYYNKLLRILETSKIPLEMHTSYIETIFPIERCVRAVYHLLSVEDLHKVRRRGSEIVRVVFVVTSEFTEETIKAISDYVAGSNQIDELSFRQMIDNHYVAQHYNEKYLRRFHGFKWYYIEQCDYNDYFVEGRVYRNFKNIGEV